MSSITHISFDFDSYDFWSGWPSRDLMAIDIAGSMDKYYTLLAKKVAEVYSAKSWTIDYSRQSSTGHKAFVTFEFGSIYDEGSEEQDYRTAEEVERAIGETEIDQEDWIIDLPVLVKSFYDDDGIFAVTDTDQSGKCIVTWHGDDDEDIQCYGWIEGSTLFLPADGDGKRDNDFLDDGTPNPDARWYECESGQLAIYGIPGSVLSLL